MPPLNRGKSHRQRRSTMGTSQRAATTPRVRKGTMSHAGDWTKVLYLPDRYANHYTTCSTPREQHKCREPTQVSTLPLFAPLLLKCTTRVATLLRGWVGNFMFLTNLWSLLNYLNVFWYLLAHHHTWCVILYHSLNNHWFTNSNNVADQTITNLHASQIVFIGNQFHVSLFKLNKCDEHCQNKIGLNTREKSDATDKQEKY